MTGEQISLARHALGFPNSKRTSYRNHFCAGQGHDDYEAWEQMVAQGDAVKANRTELGRRRYVLFDA